MNAARLRGLIRERMGTQAVFAAALGISESALVEKLAGRTEFKRSEMVKAAEVLGEPVVDIFFADEVRKTEVNGEE